MREVARAAHLRIWGERELDMPLRVLNLIYQLGLSADRIAIERRSRGQSIDAVLHVSAERGALLVEKLRSMVLVQSAELSSWEERLD